MTSPATSARVPSATVVRIGTRTSKLALWQTEHVAARLAAAWPSLRCELQPVVTQGDRRLDRPLPEIGGKGLFTAELEAALLAGEIDLAVHSLKDLPVDDAPGLTVGAILSREDVRDVLVAAAPTSLAALPAGAVVGTSSLRRQAQLLAYRPDLVIRPIRGNVDTRIRKVMEGEYTAAVMAAAGLQRLGLGQHIVEWLALEVMLPAPGQGALAVQCRASDERMRTLLAPLEDPSVRAAVTAERRLLWLLGGGCSAPVAALATWSPDGTILTLAARVASVDGAQLFFAQATGNEPERVAAEATENLLGQGAGEVLVHLPPARPLAGKRVVVTRPPDQAGELVEKLRQAGALPLEAPSIQIVPLTGTAPLAAALARVTADSWVVFTSANAVRTFLAHADARASLQPGDGRPHVAAIGPATDAALRDHGIQVDFVPSRHEGAVLAVELPLAAGATVLLPRSAIGGEDLPRRLRERGAIVDDVPIYTAEPAPLAADVVEELQRGFDAVTFTSGSTVRSFVAAAQEHPGLRRQLEHSVLACIGPATATVAEELGLRPQVVATEATVTGLVEALAAHFART